MSKDLTPEIDPEFAKVVEEEEDSINPFKI